MQVSQNVCYEFSLGSPAEGGILEEATNMQTPSTKTAPDDSSRQQLYAVLMLNDDDSPMEFVVRVLEHFFEMDREIAMRIMLDVHGNGIAQCGRYGYEEAKAKVQQVLSFAQEHRHPLRCAVEQVPST